MYRLRYGHHSSVVRFSYRTALVYTLSTVFDFRDNCRLIYDNGHWPKERHFPVMEEKKISTNEWLMALEEAIHSKSIGSIEV